MKKFLIAFFTLFMSFTIFAGVANALPAYNGYGWKIKSNSNGSWNLKHNSTFTIKFVNEDSKNKSLPYMKTTVDYLNAMPDMQDANIHFNLTSQIGGVDNFNNSWYFDSNTWCYGDFGTIYVITKWKPTGVTNQSVTHSCYRTSDNASWGGYIIMDAEYWPDNGTSYWEQSVKNIHAHELGHILGLDHPNPNYYIDGHLTPVMHTTAGGYMNSNAGKYPEDDTRGINMLIWNGS